MKTIYNANHQAIGFLNPQTGLAKTTAGDPLFLIWPDGDVQVMGFRSPKGSGMVSVDSGDDPYFWDGKAIRRYSDPSPLFYTH